jgi:hypothetical protein
MQTHHNEELPGRKTPIQLVSQWTNKRDLNKTFCDTPISVLGELYQALASHGEWAKRYFTERSLYC